ncbi:protein of unknown function (plasmid) [Azospirillum lipoferum 4B]|uniref:Uncharacterized protein n=1 Tax=Azospirillum lipoferum (strain 4B) TaxID=862719 RepID=G7ZET5_AZOL4|nr:protein of unknown function [Azospirillum lipoferum 4B]
MFFRICTPNGSGRPRRRSTPLSELFFQHTAGVFFIGRPLVNLSDPDESFGSRLSRTPISKRWDYPGHAPAAHRR